MTNIQEHWQRVQEQNRKRSLAFWRRVLGVALLVILAFLCAWLTGCATRVDVIPSDKTVFWLAPGTCYTATNWVCVVPQARMLEILRKVNQ